ncbi:MAG: zonular occludens toxin domain-containing protein, partial [Shewanella sp.]
GDSVRDLIKVVDAQFTEYGSMNRPFSKVEHYNDTWRDEQNRAALYVIDEAHMVIPTRLGDSKILEFYSMHGHYGIDIIILTQNLRKIHADIRAMIEMTYYCAKNTAFGSKNTYTKKVRIGDTREDINVEQRSYKKNYFSFYQSHTQSSGAVVESQAFDIVPIWKRWPFWGSLVCLIIFILNLGYYFQTRKPKTLDNSSSISLEHSQPVNITDSVNNTDSDSSSKRQRNLRDITFPEPLKGFDLFVSGHAKQIAYKKMSYAREIDTKLTFYHVYISAYQNDKFAFSLNNLDLQKMGYEFDALTECVYRVSFGASSRIITCIDESRFEQQQKSETVFDRVPRLDV